MLKKLKLMLWSLPENSWRRESLRYRREDEEPAGRKKFLPANQLVFRPGVGLLTLLGLVSVCPVEPAGGGDRGWRPLMTVRGSSGAGTARGGGIGCRQVAVSAGSRLGGRRAKTGGVGSRVTRYREEA